MTAPVDVLAVPASTDDMARAHALLDALAAEYAASPLDKRADCAAMCMGDLEGWLLIASEDGATRYSLDHVIKHCFWRFREDFGLEPFAALAAVGPQS